MGKKSPKALLHVISIKTAAIGFAGLLVISVLISFMIFVFINQNKSVINQAPDTQTETNYDIEYEDSIADSGSFKTADDEQVEDDITKKVPETNNSSDRNASGVNDSNSQGFNNGTTDGISMPNCSENPYLIAPPKGECKYIIENGRSATVYLNNLIADNKRFLKVTSSNSNVAFISGGNRINESSLVSNHFFKMVIRNGGKADITFSELNDETKVAVMHVAAKASSREVDSVPAAVELKKITVTCPSRETVMEFAASNPNTWINGGNISYDPTNATLGSDLTISVLHVPEYINVRLDSNTKYSVQPLGGLVNISNPITIMVKYGSISGSCTF